MVQAEEMGVQKYCEKRNRDRQIVIHLYAREQSLYA